MVDRAIAAEAATVMAVEAATVEARARLWTRMMAVKTKTRMTIMAMVATRKAVATAMEA